MKNNLLPIGLSAYTIAIIIVVIMSLTSCSSGSHGACYAYQNVELKDQ